MTSSRPIGSLPAGVLAGATLGFAETLLLYGLGTNVPAFYALVVFGAPVALCALAGLGFDLLARALARIGPRPGATVRLGAPVVLALLPVALVVTRGTDPTLLRLARGLMSLLQWGVPGALALALAVMLWRNRGVLGSSAFLRACLVAQGVCGLALAARKLTPRHLQQILELAPHRLELIVLVSLLYAALVLVVGAQLVRRRPEPSASLAAATLALSAVGAGLAAFHSIPLPPAERPDAALGAPRPRVGPDVLLIVLDTVRRDHLSCYGYPRKTTPALDTFAARATLFENAHSSSAYTLSSHASLFTGLLPSAHGARPVPFETFLPARSVSTSGSLDHVLDTRAETLAETLARKGWRTGAISANHAFLAEWTGLSRGFEYYSCRATRNFPYWPASLGELTRSRFDPRLFDKRNVTFLSAGELTDAALSFWDATRGQSALLFLNYFDAHQPYAPPPPFDEKFQAEVPQGGETRPQGRGAARMALYDGEISFLDANVGRLLEGLERQGRLDDMLVVITADHGEAFDEHGVEGHGSVLYQEVLAIPLIVKLPGQRRGARLATLVALHDVPALVGRALDGVREPAELVAGLPAGPRVIAEQWTSVGAHRLDPERFRSPAVRAIFDGSLKLIHKPGDKSELYDLALDPGERNDLMVSSPERAAAIEQRLFAAVGPFEIELDRPAAAPPNEVDAEALRALGYIH